VRNPLDTGREERERSADAVRSFPHAIPIQEASPELVASVLARIDAAAAERSPKQTAALEIALGEREPD